jgi:hypothetical protein
MAVLFLMCCFGYLLEALLVGFALKWFIHRFHLKLNLWKCVVSLFIVFALYSLYDLLLLSPLGVTFTVNNVEIANALHLSPNTPLDAFLAPHVSDVLFWFLQALVAAGIALGIDRSPCNTEQEKTDPLSPN